MNGNYRENPRTQHASSLATKRTAASAWQEVWNYCKFSWQRSKNGASTHVGATHMVRRRQKKTSVKCKNVQKTKQTAFDSSPHLQRCVYCGQMDQLATSIACFKRSRRSVSDMFLCHAQLAGAMIIFRCWFFHTLLSAPLLPCFCPWAVLLSLEVGLSTLVAALCFFGLSFSCADLTWQSRWRFSWD